MNKVGKQDLIEAYESIEVSLQQRIALTPVSQFKQLLHDFTQLYRTKGKLARLKGVSANG
ncbi:hypothetical protein CT113_03870 [Levilactobacillus brevis]|uniref:hypothetical protein n=1 Tax=Levilactobacillus brevis TaxID=1580 RepID=UPI0004128AC9|nr:hypothetical protein [Levilactobacillus brevis]ATU69523.1 hypothetical protein CT113_03870 [Levilactobacillus brevis]KID42889.1 hypothetical protein LbDm2_2218 [Levilactobacillus brevis]